MTFRLARLARWTHHPRSSSRRWAVDPRAPAGSPRRRPRGGAGGAYALRIDADLLYRQHLSEADRRLLLALFPPDADLVAALGSPALEAAVFGAGDATPGGAASGTWDATPGAAVSPFLAFAVAVHRTAAALETATFVDERTARRRRLPVFDAAALRTVLRDPLRRYFFVELLASYTRVSSGATWRRTSLGWRRQRVSELDPARLATLLDVVGPSERPGVYRRLGDLCLFLLGVFPDHPPQPTGAGADRLLRHGGLRADEAADLDGLALFERLGSTWYRAAARLAGAPRRPLTGTSAVLGDVADHFHDARRVLNEVTDRYLFLHHARWFPG